MFRKNKNSEKNRCPRKEHPVWSLARSANMFFVENIIRTRSVRIQNEYFTLAWT